MRKDIGISFRSVLGRRETMETKTIQTYDWILFQFFHHLRIYQLPPIYRLSLMLQHLHPELAHSITLHPEFPTLLLPWQLIRLICHRLHPELPTPLNAELSTMLCAEPPSVLPIELAQRLLPEFPLHHHIHVRPSHHRETPRTLAFMPFISPHSLRRGAAQMADALSRVTNIHFGDPASPSQWIAFSNRITSTQPTRRIPIHLAFPKPWHR